MSEFLKEYKDIILIIFMILISIYSIFTLYDTIVKTVKHIIYKKGFEKMSFIFQRHIYLQLIFLCFAAVLWIICYIYLFEIE